MWFVGVEVVGHGSLVCAFLLRSIGGLEGLQDAVEVEWMGCCRGVPYGVGRVGGGGVFFECGESVERRLGEESAGVVESVFVCGEDEEGGGFG